MLGSMPTPPGDCILLRCRLLLSPPGLLLLLCCLLGAWVLGTSEYGIYKLLEASALPLVHVLDACCYFYECL